MTMQTSGGTPIAIAADVDPLAFEQGYLTTLEGETHDQGSPGCARAVLSPHASGAIVRPLPRGPASSVAARAPASTCRGGETHRAFELVTLADDSRVTVGADPPQVVPVLVARVGEE